MVLKIFLVFYFFFICAEESTVTSAVINTTLTPSTSSTVSETTTTQYFKSRDPNYLPENMESEISEESKEYEQVTKNQKERLDNLITPTSELHSIKDSTTTKTNPPLGNREFYPLSASPEVDNNVFKEFMRLSKLTEYMLLDPKFAEDVSFIP